MRLTISIPPAGAGLALLATLAGCFYSPSDPDAGSVAQVAVGTEFPPALSAGLFALDVDRARLLLIRPPSELLLDTTVFFATDSSRLTVRLRATLSLPREQLSLSMELRSGKRLLFAGTRSFEAVEGTTVAPIVPLQYLGPGTELTSLRVEPRDSVLKPGDVATFLVGAFQGSIPVDSFYVGWSTSSPQSVPVNARGTLRAPGERGSVWLRAVAPTGIKDSTRVWFSPPPAAFERVAGDDQTGPVGDPLPVPLRVRVTASDGLGVPGTRVRFSGPFGSRVTDTLVITDAEGYGQTTAILGPTPTLYTFEARIPVYPPVTFRAIGVAGPPATLEKAAGDGQFGPVGAALAPLGVVVRDHFGNPVGGAPVAWEVVSGGGSLDVPTSVTDASGLATVTWRLGPVPGPNAVRASAGAAPPVTFTATATP